MTEAVQAMSRQMLDLLQKAQDKLVAQEKLASEPIAIIGMACRVPGADNPQAYRDLLNKGVEAIGEIPAGRWDVDAYYSPDEEAQPAMYTRRMGAIADPAGFDPLFFGISPREAERMDPQQRLLLEVCWEALEDAGIAPDRLRNSATGVFVGTSAFDYWLHSSADYRQGNTDLGRLVDHHASLGNIHSVAVGRISYILGLQGPNFHLDTACSSSLVAAHQACQSLRSGESDLALVGGVNLILSPMSTILFCKLTALSRTGHCRAFDAAADGYVRGEGCGILVLKRLSAAQADGDRIWAVIRGSAINHDGPSNGLTAPNVAAQEKVIRQALKNAKVQPHEVAYVEAHGTGTPLGDPIEVEALSAVFQERAHPLLIGSVKTNIGHLEAAAGVMSVMKVIWALQQELIPAQLHFQTPNPYVDWATTPVKVVSAPTPWPRPDGVHRRIAGVSSFGFSGTNAHLILEEAPTLPPAAAGPERPYHLLTLSAQSQPALRALAQAYHDYLRAQPEIPLGDLCYTAYTGRNHFAHRLSVAAPSAAQLQADLAAYTQGTLPPSMTQGVVQEYQAAPKIAFLFTGQGAQYVGMGRELYTNEPTFRAVIDRCEAVFQALLGRSLIDLLYPAATPSHQEIMTVSAYVQATNFALQCALVELWRTWGVTPTMVLSHSLGDFAAAYAAGVFTLEDGLRLVIERGQLMATATGSMVAVLAAETEVLPFIADFTDVTIGVVNGPRSVVISGGSTNVLLAAERLQRAGFKTRKLAIPVAAHSPLLDPVLDAFEAAVRTVKLSPPRLPVISSMSGKLITQEVTDPRYWRQQLRATVRFADGVQQVRAAGCTLFLEIGPNPTLLGIIKQVSDDDATLTLLPSLREDRNAWQQMVESLGALYTHGNRLDWAGFDQHSQRRKLTLPTYPFQRKRYWLAAPTPNGVVRSASPVLRAIEAGNITELQRRLSGNGDQPFTDAESTLVAKVLHLLVEEHRASTPAAHAPTAAAIYDGFLHLHEKIAQAQGVGADQVATHDDYLSYGILPEIVPGFSWLRLFALPEKPPEHLQLMRAAQNELRRLLFAPIDFMAIRKVMDIGCGLGTDLIHFAEQYPHLSLTGNTISPAQAAIGQQKVTARALQARVTIRHRNSVTDALPAELDLVFGIEVVAHIKDKEQLFANIAQHLNAGGHLLLADYVAHTQTVIEDDTSSSYMITKAAWVALLATHHLRLVRAVEISEEVANYLHVPDLEAELAALQIHLNPQIEPVIRAFNQTQHLLRRGIASYVLFTARYEPEAALPDLLRDNEASLDQMSNYTELTPHRWLYTVAWQPRPHVDLPPAYLPTAAQITEQAGDVPAEATQSVATPAVAQTVLVAQAATDPVALGQPWLIFADGTGMGAALAEALRQRGDFPLLVHAGAAYQQMDNASYQIQPERAEHYRQLLEDVEAVIHRRDPVQVARLGVVHLWSLDAARAVTNSRLDQAAALSCGTVLQLVQALLHKSVALTGLWLVTSDAQTLNHGTPAPANEGGVAQAALWGMGKVIALEHPELNCVLVDLHSTQQGMAPGDSSALTIQVQGLVAELTAPTLADRHVAQQAAPHETRMTQQAAPREEQVALRAGTRYVARLTRFAAQAQPPFRCRADATYVITGGLGGIGLAMAEWLVEQGAGHLLLIGRSRPRPAVQTRIAAWQDKGARITTAQVDVTDWPALSTLFRQIDLAYPLRGVIHAAGVLDDGALLQQDWARFAAVLAPKVQGAWHLHTLTSGGTGQPALDFFVLCSSASSLLGNQGQANYAAANAFLDALAHYRRAQGLPALSINWGAWRDVGMAAAFVQKNQEQMKAHGLGAITPTAGIACFAQLLTQEAAQVGVTPIHWSRYLAGDLADKPFYTAFRPAVTMQSSLSTAAAVSLRQQLCAAPAEERTLLLLTQLQNITATVLGIATPAQIDPRQGLWDLGLDSLLAVELRNHIGRLLETQLPSTVIFDYPTLDKLSAFLVATMDGDDADMVETTALPSPPEATWTAIDQLSTDDLIAQIAQTYQALQ